MEALTYAWLRACNQIKYNCRNIERWRFHACADSEGRFVRGGVLTVWRFGWYITHMIRVWFNPIITSISSKDMKWQSLLFYISPLQTLQSWTSNLWLLWRCISRITRFTSFKPELFWGRTPFKLLPGTWSHLSFAGVRECPPWCSIVGATVTVHQFFCILYHIRCRVM